MKCPIQNKDYMLDLCVRMAHHSTAIEGNTLTQDETRWLHSTRCKRKGIL